VPQQNFGRQNYLFDYRLTCDRHCTRIFTNKHKNYCMLSYYQHVQGLLHAYRFCFEVWLPPDRFDPNRGSLFWLVDCGWMENYSGWRRYWPAVCKALGGYSCKIKIIVKLKNSVSSQRMRCFLWFIERRVLNQIREASIYRMIIQ